MNEEDSLKNNFYTVKKFAEKNKARGCWPESESAIWALRAWPDKGFGEAFVKIGRRVLIEEEKFWEILKKQKENNQ